MADDNQEQLGEEQQPPAVEDPTPPAGVSAEEMARLRSTVEQQARQIQQLGSRREAPQQQPPAAPAVMDRKAIESEFWKNPLEVTSTIARIAAAEAQQNLMGSLGGTIYEMAKSKAREKNPELFDRYRDEIEAAVASAPENIRSNVAVWTNAMNIVFGSHIDEISASKPREGGAPAVRTRGDGPSAPGTRSAPAPVAVKLTEEQQAMARNLRITDDEYRHGLEILERQDAKGPSVWDEVVTTDSDKARREKRAAATRK